jgi:hypothetical protein
MALWFSTVMLLATQALSALWYLQLITPQSTPGSFSCPQMDSMGEALLSDGSGRSGLRTDIFNIPCAS